jgi:hypothetical protein
VVTAPDTGDETLRELLALVAAGAGVEARRYAIR